MLRLVVNSCKDYETMKFWRHNKEFLISLNGTEIIPGSIVEHKHSAVHGSMKFGLVLGTEIHPQMQIVSCFVWWSNDRN